MAKKKVGQGKFLTQGHKHVRTNDKRLMKLGKRHAKVTVNQG